jgi:uncharacterized protein YdiU (UPF0061 family)
MNLETLSLKTPYLLLDKEFYHINKVTPLDNPYLISYSLDAAQLIELSKDSLDDLNFVALLNGTFFLKGANNFATCYAGHQFGSYAYRLGDGRAIHLGKTNNWNLQLKGAGETLYSRTADGRTTISSSIREYLMSEAMHHLGIPTTRALGIIGSKTKILRNSIEYGAIVMRMSTTWVRFGTFEYFYYNKDYENLNMLAQYVLEESYSHLEKEDDKFEKMFSEIVDKTAVLIAKWQAVGFCHGVLNTDNMSIAGLGMDYGPFSMLDDFNYGYVCNHTDKAGRYSFAEQANVSYWNLTKLAKALSPLASTNKMQEKLDEYGSFIYPNTYLDCMLEKLGLEVKFEDDMSLVEELLVALQDGYVDYTIFFRTLSKYDGDKSLLYDIAMNPMSIHKWLEIYDKRLAKESISQKQRQKNMLSVNPKYVLKNYMLEDAIQKVKMGDFSKVEILLNIASHPYDELEEYEEFAKETPEEYKNIGLFCSS